MNDKININFAAMKVLRKILIKSFFLLAVFLSLGINSFMNYNLLHTNNEISSYTSIVENIFSLFTDTPNGDQIGQSDNSVLSREQSGIIPLRQAYLPNHIFCISIWQPPKIS